MQIIFVAVLSAWLPLETAKFFKTRDRLACENIRFSSLFAAGDVSRNVSSDEERGETDVFAG